MTLRPDAVHILGPGRVPSPLSAARFVEDSARVLVDAHLEAVAPYLRSGQEPPSFEVAGPRSLLWFDPKEVVAGIVTCGGLCPGLNNVIRGLALTLDHVYGVRRVLGFRYGYAGLAAHPPAPPMELTRERVERIHETGGTVLGTSRGPQDIDEMIDTLERHAVRVLFAIGGDGTLRGAARIAERVLERGAGIAVIGVPKTIDNDICWITRSFGFTTAVERAEDAIAAAHAEATGVLNGVGLVKLMGRYSGSIAATATLANHDVNFCLVPEFPVPIEGPNGFLAALEARLDERRHAVVVVAEGFGQDFLMQGVEPRYDASGNRKLEDVGVWLRDRIRAWFREHGKPVDVKYIDPSYVIRSGTACAFDAELCQLLAQHAVHAAMCGRTGIVIGQWNGRFTHVPIALAVAERRQLGPDDPIWQRVLEATGQAALFARGELEQPVRQEPTR